MISYLDNNYGADADGNRGVSMWFNELEPSDDAEIIRQLLEQYPDFNFPETTWIRMINPITEDDVDFEITIKDYAVQLKQAQIIQEAIEITELISFENAHILAQHLAKDKHSAALALCLELIQQLSLRISDPA